MSPIEIFTNIALPIFILIGIGFIADKAFKFDIPTLSRFIFNIMTPAVIFLAMMRSDLQASEIVTTFVYALLHAAAMAVLAAGIFRLKPFRSRQTILGMGAVFYNAGNYGFPLMLLAFGEKALSTMAVVIQVQIILMFTIGLLVFLDGDGGVRGSLERLLKMPVMYAIPLGFLVRALHVTIPQPLLIPLDHINGGFVALSLITLGAQLSRSKIAGELGSIAGISVVRLAFSPVVAVGLVLLLRMPDDLAMTLTLGAGLPVAVNVFVIASEFDRDPDFASRMVFWSTLLSAVTIPVLLMILNAV